MARSKMLHVLKGQMGLTAKTTLQKLSHNRKIHLLLCCFVLLFAHPLPQLYLPLSVLHIPSGNHLSLLVRALGRSPSALTGVPQAALCAPRPARHGASNHTQLRVALHILIFHTLDTSDCALQTKAVPHAAVHQRIYHMQASQCQCQHEVLCCAVVPEAVPPVSLPWWISTGLPCTLVAKQEGSQYLRAVAHCWAALNRQRWRLSAYTEQKGGTHIPRSMSLSELWSKKPQS